MSLDMKGEPMNVYAIQDNETYGGEMAIVAAHSAEEATQIATGIFDLMWHVRYHNPTKVELLPLVFEGDTPTVIVHYEIEE